VVHEKLARKYGITTEPPEELRELLAPKGKTKVGEKTAEKEAKSKRKVRNIWLSFFDSEVEFERGLDKS
jgi:hypothetical protein